MEPSIASTSRRNMRRRCWICGSLSIISRRSFGETGSQMTPPPPRLVLAERVGLFDRSTGCVLRGASDAVGVPFGLGHHLGGFDVRLRQEALRFLFLDRQDPREACRQAVVVILRRDSCYLARSRFERSGSSRRPGPGRRRPPSGRSLAGPTRTSGAALRRGSSPGSSKPVLTGRPSWSSRSLHTPRTESRQLPWPGLRAPRIRGTGPTNPPVLIAGSSVRNSVDESSTRIVRICTWSVSGPIAIPSGESSVSVGVGEVRAVEQQDHDQPGDMVHHPLDPHPSPVSIDDDVVTTVSFWSPSRLRRPPERRSIGEVAESRRRPDFVPGVQRRSGSDRPVVARGRTTSSPMWVRRPTRSRRRRGSDLSASPRARGHASGWHRG